ncbi:DoxX family protein [Rhizobium sp. CCGE 510]|uniref:DoxX family protein n=1 Tax=Rhizobium sp. CCGE 510 TaxID=1132836 RepID=UPI00027B8B3F|nr:DoxX family protein [Rhizobium sp. CCGE 510]EJT02324.1 putative transmembrane protein [Rhizobium sp. CCGE 510]
MLEFYVYWISTTLLSALYLASAYLYATKGDWVRGALTDLGFKAPYLIPLMIAIKVLGPIAILSRVSVPLSDLAYAGIFFHLLLSGLAHIGARKPFGALPAAIGLALLVASFTTQNDARDLPSPYVQAAVARCLDESQTLSNGDVHG